MNEDNALYREIQYFNQPWLRIIIILPAAAVLASFVFTLSHDTPIGNMGTVQDDWANWLFIFVVTFTFPVIFFSSKLVIEVTKEGIRYRFYPFHIHWHRLLWNDIQTADARVYRPIREYGGWGIRFGRYGKAYNVSGNEGVLVTLTKGETIMFGSRQMNDFEVAIKMAMKDFHSKPPSV